MSTENTLFPELMEQHEEIKPRFRGYLASPFIAAALPLKDVNKPVFERKYNNIILRLTSDSKVPFGRYGRLLLSILTTHAVIEKNSKNDGPVTLTYRTLQELLDELQLPKQRGKDIKEQLECFAGASFVFKEKRTKVTQKLLFKDFYEDGEKMEGEVTATQFTTGIVPFFESMQYIDLKEKGRDRKSVGITIILSEKFRQLSQVHSVPIDYTAYKEISSAVGKDLYAWFVYKNNSLTDEPVFIQRSALVNQFLPLKENNYESEERVNWNTIKEQINLIKKKYYQNLNVSIAQDNSGITLSKSEPVILENDTRYVLVTSTL